VFLLGPADFVCGGFAHGLADGRPGHAVLGRCDPIRDGLPRHLSVFTYIYYIYNNDVGATQLNVTSLSSGGKKKGGVQVPGKTCVACSDVNH